MRNTSTWQAAALAAVLVGVGGCAARSLWSDPRVAPRQHAEGPTPPTPATALAELSPTRHRPVRHERLAAPPTPTQTATPLDFDAAVARLMEHAQSIRAAVEGDDQSLARQHDDAARQLIERILDEIGDAPQRALGQLGPLWAGTQPTETEPLRARVLDAILRRGLADLYRRAHDHRDLRRLDTLAQACLDCLALGPTCAQRLGLGQLADRPYLGAAHESTVLALLDDASDLEFLQPVVTALLRTLWHNLIDSGARNAEEIAALALRLAEHEQPHRREAALLHLLTAAGGRHREHALQLVRASGDQQLRAQIQQEAASRLPLPDAVEIIIDLEGAAPAFGAWARLGERQAPSDLAARYRQALAEPGSTALRRGLLQAAMAQPPSTAAARFAEDALRRDPDDAVRRQALLALGSQADAASFERCLVDALHDPERASDPVWMDHLVAALDNAAHGLTVERIGYLARQLAQSPALSEQGATSLGEITRRSRRRGR